MSAILARSEADANEFAATLADGIAAYTVEEVSIQSTTPKGRPDHVPPDPHRDVDAAHHRSPQAALRPRAQAAGHRGDQWMPVMTSTNRLLLEQIAIRLYEQDFGSKPDTPWDQITRKMREDYRRCAGNMAREVGVS